MDHDTTILPAVNVAIQGLRNEVQDGFKSLHERLDKLHDGNLESAKWQGQQEQKVTAAHRRIDEIREEVVATRKAADEAGGPGWKGWAVILAALLTGIAGIIAAWRGDAAHAKDTAAAQAKETK